MKTHISSFLNTELLETCSHGAKVPFTILPLGISYRSPAIETGSPGDQQMVPVINPNVLQPKNIVVFNSCILEQTWEGLSSNKCFLIAKSLNLEVNEASNVKRWKIYWKTGLKWHISDIFLGKAVIFQAYKGQYKDKHLEKCKVTLFYCLY